MPRLEYVGRRTDDRLEHEPGDDQRRERNQDAPLCRYLDRAADARDRPAEHEVQADHDQRDDGCNDD